MTLRFRCEIAADVAAESVLDAANAVDDAIAALFRARKVRVLDGVESAVDGLDEDSRRAAKLLTAHWDEGLAE